MYNLDADNSLDSVEVTRELVISLSALHFPISFDENMKVSLLIIILFFSPTVLTQECASYQERIDCNPGPNASPEDCVQRGCHWCPLDVGDLRVPYCYLPTSYGYKMINIDTSDNGVKVRLRRNTDVTYFGGDSETILFEAEFQSDYRLRIKISDETPRWEVPLQINPATGGNSNHLYRIQLRDDPVFAFKVIRTSTGSVLFDTTLGGLTFADQFLQLATKLPSTNVYGIGENEQHTFRHSFNNTLVWALYARDQAPNHNANIYGVQPHYTVLEEDGNAYSVVTVNSNAQEYVMHPNPAIVYRTIGGILDLYLFLGPTPENTVQQYTEAVGRTPLPPYWALGFQLCKYGYNTLDNMKAAVDRTAQYNIPHDVQYGDIDIMDRALDFTIDQNRFGGLPEYVQELKARGMKFMTILDPCISIGEPAGTYRPYELGNEMDVWLKRPDGSPTKGKVWPLDPVYFPDYFKNSTKEWWRILIVDFAKILEFDALWIDMNEPANFIDGDWDGCENNKWNNPPYVPGITGGIYHFTLCADTVDDVGIHYNTHSLYGWSESEPTISATTEAIGKRTFVLSRSTFLGSGKWLSHWLGDNWSRWSNLHYSIIGVLQFNQFGMPFVGPDICGHIGDTTQELCHRWSVLGAFYPFSRNHNADGNIDQDPGMWPDVAESARTALNIRYTLLPYLYTLLANHYVNGNTVARALWHEFPTDSIAAGIDRQFLWGSGFMISPVLDIGETTVRAYFPADRFFNYYDGTEIQTRQNFETLDAPLNFINLHIRGGHIIPTQEPAVNTELSRQNPLGLIVALDDLSVAKGSLYYDSGDSLNPIDNNEYFMADYSASNGVLDAVVVHNAYPEMSQKRLDTIRLLGAPRPTEITINGVIHSFVVQDSGEVLIQNINLPANSAFQMVYN